MVQKIGRIDYRDNQEMPKIDSRDTKILSLLAQNARRPLKEIARSVHLSADAVAYRISRLEQKNILLRCVPVLSYARLGQGMFHILFLLDETSTKRKEEFFSMLCAHPNVISVMEYSDRWDLEVVLLAKNIGDFDTLSLELTKDFDDVILDREEGQVMKRYTSSSFPVQKAIQPDSPVFTEMQKLEETDYDLLFALCEDARQSTYTLSSKINVSPDTVRYRMKRLEQQGIILGYTVLVRFSLLGFVWRTLSLEVKTFSVHDEAMLREFLHQHPQVIRAVKLLGHSDILLYIVTDTSVRFHAIVRELKRTFAHVMILHQNWLALTERVHVVLPFAVQK